MRIFCIIILLLATTTSIAQYYSDLGLDTMYHISLTYYRDDLQQQPHSGFCFVKDLNNYYICIDNKDSIENTFYNNSFYSFDLDWEFRKSREMFSEYEYYKSYYLYNMDKLSEYTQCNYTDSINCRDNVTYFIFTIKKIIGLFYKEDIEKRITLSCGGLPFTRSKNNNLSYFYRCFAIIECKTVSKEESIKIFK